MTNPESRFSAIMKDQFPQEGGSFLLAVSGGLDSVVLTELAWRAGLSIELAHCHFGLRGEESDRDASFVKDLAGRLGLKLHLKHFDTKTIAETLGVSIQEAARTIRYEWFDELVEQHHFSALLLGHHADDSIETTLMNFFRGTGVKGLTGIPVRNGSRFRPLLSFRRAELLDYARMNGLQWVEDSSNAGSDYTRNFFRNELLPRIREVFPSAEENLLRNISRFTSVNDYIERHVKKDLDAMLEKKGEEWRLPVRKFKKLGHDILLYELVKPFGFGEKQLGDIKSLLDATNGKFIESQHYQLVKHGLWLYISPRIKEEGLFLIEEDQQAISNNEFELLISKALVEGVTIDPSAAVAQLDASDIRYPLVLRRWKAGDYFYPLGLRKKKKIARFLIDSKVPKHRKEKLWVLESDKRIIWVVGMRIDDRFKITPATSSLLLITMQNKA